MVIGSRPSLEMSFYLTFLVMSLYLGQFSILTGCDHLSLLNTRTQNLQEHNRIFFEKPPSMSGDVIMSAQNIGVLTFIILKMCDLTNMVEKYQSIGCALLYICFFLIFIVFQLQLFIVHLYEIIHRAPVML